MTTASKKFVWTPELVARLQQMWTDGSGSKSIAIAFGTTRSAVCGKAHRLGLKKADKKPARSATPKRILQRVKSKPAPLQIALHAEPPVACNDTDAAGVPFMDLGFAECRYFTVGRGMHALCCGAPTVSETVSYCATHARLVFDRSSSSQSNRQRELVEP